MSRIAQVLGIIMKAEYKEQHDELNKLKAFLALYFKAETRYLFPGYDSDKSALTQLKHFQNKCKEYKVLVPEIKIETYESYGTKYEYMPHSHYDLEIMIGRRHGDYEGRTGGNYEFIENIWLSKIYKLSYDEQIPVYRMIYDSIMEGKDEIAKKERLSSVFRNGSYDQGAETFEKWFQIEGISLLP